MTKKQSPVYLLGEFLRELRTRKGVSLMEVEKDTGISNAYLSQLETGTRKKLPSPERLRILSDYYNVSVEQFLEKAGYFKPGEIKETYESKVEKAFQHAINDPAFKFGARLKGKYDLDAKRFIIEMYEKATKKKILQ